jgi:hypothetical protein
MKFDKLWWAIFWIILILNMPPRFRSFLTLYCNSFVCFLVYPAPPVVYPHLFADKLFFNCSLLQSQFLSLAKTLNTNLLEVYSRG